MSLAKEWSTSSALEYYSKNRHEISDLYPSEKVFLPRVLFPGAKVLDIGCASGGLYNIMRTMEPAIEFTGIDISEAVVDLARRNYPEARFEVGEGSEMPYEDGTFDLVHCTSLFCIEPHYEEIIRVMYRVSNRFVLVDMRLLKGIGNDWDIEKSYYDIQFSGETVQGKVPYVVSDVDEVANFVLGLDPKPKAIRGTGYFHEVAKEAHTPFKEACMSILLIQKGDVGTTITELDLENLPIEFSAASH